jgi:hypothetical protein
MRDFLIRWATISFLSTTPHPIRFHGVLFKWLSTGTNLHLLFTLKCWQPCCGHCACVASLTFFPQNSRYGHASRAVPRSLSAKLSRYMLQYFLTEILYWRWSNGFDFSSYRSNITLYSSAIEIEFCLVSETVPRARTEHVANKAGMTHYTHLWRRMPSSGMLRRVALVRTDISEKLSASIIRVTRIGQLGQR